MTRAETLRTAAERVREVGAPAIPGPYTVSFTGGVPGGTVWRGRVQLATTQERIGTPRPHMADWIALADPRLAKPLPDLLEAVANLIEARPELERSHVSGGPCEDLACQIVHLALAAAAILGGEA